MDSKKPKIGEPMKCSHGYPLIRCQKCPHYYFDGLGYCDFDNPKEKKEKPGDYPAL